MEPEALRDRVGRWLTWANDDLALARSALADPEVVRRGACTWAHQCAERALKAMVVAPDLDPPRPHNLLRLEQMTPPDVRAELASVNLEALTRWAIEGRYPEDLAEATETGCPTRSRCSRRSSPGCRSSVPLFHRAKEVIVRTTVEGRAVFRGKTLREWVPVIVGDIVAAFDPLQIVLFGSVARGDDGPDSDIDLLVVLPHVDPSTRHELMSAMSLALSVPLAVDFFPTDPREFARRRDVIGSLHYWPAREGRTVYERPS